MFYFRRIITMYSMSMWVKNLVGTQAKKKGWEPLHWTTHCTFLTFV